GRHGDVHRGHVGVRGAVVGLVGKAVGPVVVGGRDVGERTVGVDGDRAVGGVGDLGRRQGVAVDVGVVAQHAGGGGGGGGVLVGREGAFPTRRSSDLGRHGDVHRGHVGVRGAVVGLVGKAVGPVVVGGRDVGERT